MDPLYQELEPFADLPRREKYIQTYKTLLRLLPEPTHKGMKQHLADYWHVSLNALENRAAFVLARDMRLFSIWGCIQFDKDYQPFQRTPSPLEVLRRNLA